MKTVEDTISAATERPLQTYAQQAIIWVFLTHPGDALAKTYKLGGKWSNVTDALTPKKYTCGHCHSIVASSQGISISGTPDAVYICTYCNRPTFHEGNTQQPGVAFGELVKHITDKGVGALYEEARECTSAGAYTAAVLCCRKLLMHIAVDKGAAENLTFKQYVEYLADNHLVAAGSEDWVALIKDKGNEANHEIVEMKQEEAERVLTFAGMLLKLVYEFPGELSPPDGQSG